MQATHNSKQPMFHGRHSRGKSSIVIILIDLYIQEKIRKLKYYVLKGPNGKNYLIVWNIIYIQIEQNS